MEVKPQKMAEIMTVVHRYINKYKYNDFIDYYDLFNLDASKSADALIEEVTMRKYKSTFHPDFIYNIPENLREDYPAVCDCLKEFLAILTSPHLKVNYDRQRELILKPKPTSQQVKEATINETTIVDEPFEEEIDEDIREEREIVFQIFGKYLLPTCARYGLDQCREAVKSYIEYGNIKDFSLIQDSRSKIALFNRKVVINHMALAYPSLTAEQMARAIVKDSINYYGKMLDLATEATYIKRGNRQARFALEKLYRENSVKAFSNFKIRQALRKSEISKDNVSFVLANNLGINLDNGPYIGNFYILMVNYFKLLETRTKEKEATTGFRM